METKTFCGSLDDLLLENLFDYPFRARLFELQAIDCGNENEVAFIVPKEHQFDQPMTIRWEMQPNHFAFSQWSSQMSRNNTLPTVRELLAQKTEVHLGFERYNPLGRDRLIEVYVGKCLFRMFGPAFHLDIAFSQDDDLNKPPERPEWHKKDGKLCWERLSS